MRSVISSLSADSRARASDSFACTGPEVGAGGAGGGGGGEQQEETEREAAHPG